MAAEAPAGAAIDAFAPAKVNLFLHVTGRRADGYHLLDSLAVFPEVGDRVAARPARGLSLRLEGPFAGGLAEEADNLVLRAARGLASAHGLAPDAALTLDKRLPPASGIGGGSSDAAAALRLLARLWGVTVPEDLAPSLGADVPVCLSAPEPRRMSGVGEALAPPAALPGFWMVLANPGVAVSTAAAFAALAGRYGAPAPPAPAFRDLGALVAWLRPLRNDLETPARVICPAVAEVLAALEDAPLVRMSGSGATCFALHAEETAARAQAGRLRTAHPGWWVTVAPVAPWRCGRRSSTHAAQKK